PCKICGERSSGFHYGVNTCEACKGFFRPQATSLASYRCINGGKCQMTAEKRGLCGACRYKKCLAVGM
ncbi:hypothetical protein HELRODRAFT_127391, partial [Helobdella robusta]|uniref:Nuclear receptor domain-containing protein n=1 Tax=Helobdella robusta TaxID=6412 RepID=T1EHE4_HELRO